MRRRTIVGRAAGAARRAAGVARALSPTAIAERVAEARAREATERALAALPSAGAPVIEGPVLVDGMYDNPNYWIRYAVLRAALGLSARREIGVLGRYRARVSRRTFARLGIGETLRVTDLHGDRSAHDRQATQLLSTTRHADDILRWTLPENVPAALVYDGVLRRQRTAVIDLDDRRLAGWVAEALGSIAASTRLLESTRPALIVLSHAVNFQFGSLAWIATKRGIPVVLGQGHYGVPRFTRLRAPADLWATMDHPTAADLASLSAEREVMLASAGRAYLAARLGGRTADLGARYAFTRAAERVDRAAIAERFAWDPERPIVAVYASNWFDFPHTFGMTQFRDLLDWMRATVAAAMANRRVSWLFRAHPCDAWYGGVTLSDLMPSLAGHDHVRLVPPTVNGAAVMGAVDGLVTAYSTAGVEYAAMGKPVLVSDAGWYHDTGFVRFPRTRAEYLDALATDWWKDLDLEVATRRAQAFAGWYFARPAWQDGFLLDDDTAQGAIYRTAPGLLADHPAPIARELATIRAWFASGQPYYHTFKMSQADALAW